MISDRAKSILSEGVSKEVEATVLFIEEENDSLVLRLFRAGEGAGDPEEQAVRWLGRARILCRSAHGDLRTRMVRSKNEESVMASVSGSEIEAREWTEETDVGELRHRPSGGRPHRSQ